MADPKSDQTPIVTLNTLLGSGPRPTGTESTGPESVGPESAGPETTGTPVRGEVVDRYYGIVAKLQEETRESGEGVLIAVQDRDASMLQSLIAERGEAGPPLPSGGLEAKFGEGITGGDSWGWIRSLLDHIDESRWHPIVRPPDTTAGALPDSARVAIIGDWGTNLYGAPVSAASIAATGGYALLLHLGDIYYSGTPRETRERFLDAWPAGAASMSRALNGNHEMYSGGFAYYDDILPRFGQASSYFALQNAHWLLVGLDTAHSDHALDDAQVAWLNAVVQAAGPRKLVLFSHHQPFSRLDKQGPKLQAALAGLLQANAVTAWYWGHEHNCIIYDRHPGFGLLGRCVGHGGIPAPRKPEVRHAASAAAAHGIAWKRLAQNAEAPACLVLDGPNPLVPGEEEKFGPHGYVTLDFDGPGLTERVHLPDGTEIFRATVA